MILETSSILLIIMNVIIFRKMGKEGWEAIIPFYSQYIIFEEIYGNGWRFLTLLIPLFNIYVLIKLNIDIAHKFDQSTAFGLGMFFFAPIFSCIVALSKNIQYKGIHGSYVDLLGDIFGSNR